MKTTALAFALAVCAHIGAANAQTDAQPQPAPAPQAIPGIIVLPPPQPQSTLPAGRQDPETCPANDLKKLELVS